MKKNYETLEMSELELPNINDNAPALDSDTPSNSERIPILNVDYFNRPQSICVVALAVLTISNIGILIINLLIHTDNTSPSLSNLVTIILPFLLK